MAVLDTIVIVGLMLQGPSAVDPQGTATSAEPRDPSLDRIGARLGKPPRITLPPTTPPPVTTGPGDGASFQVHIEEWGMPEWDWLDTGTPVPGYVRPSYLLTHHEFLLSVTPEKLRGATVHPFGVPVLSIARVIAKASSAAAKRRREAAARRDVKEALALFEASRRNAKDQ